MRCFSLTKDKFTEGIDFSKYPGCIGFEPGLAKTAAIHYYMEPEWDCTYAVNAMKNHSMQDIFLYGCTTFVPGNSISSVIPEDCFAIEVPLDYRSYGDDQSMPALVGVEHCVRLCYEGTTCIKTPSGKYITNLKGTPTLSTAAIKLDKAQETSGWLLEL